MKSINFLFFVILISSSPASSNPASPNNYKILIDQVKRGVKANFNYQYTCTQFRWLNTTPYPQIPIRACNRSRFKTNRECNLMISEFKAGEREFEGAIHQYLAKRSEREFVLKSYLARIKNSIGRGLSQPEYEDIKTRKTKEFYAKEEKDLKEIITLIMCLEGSINEMKRLRLLEYGK